MNFCVFTALLLSFLSGNAFGATHLLLVGGGARPDSAIRRFVEWSGAESSRILIVGWASSIPGEYARSLAAEFSAGGAAQVLISERPPENALERVRFLSLLAAATGVFFTGGDQNRAMEAIETQALGAELRSRFERGVPFAGTSAGTALMARTMMTGGESPRTSSGLGLFVPAVIDMHFLKRNREPRLIAAMESSGVPFGIGVDEDGALAIEDSVRGEVLGLPHVVFYEAKEGRILRYELQDRERFDLRQWRPE